MSCDVRGAPSPWPGLLPRQVRASLPLCPRVGREAPQPARGRGAPSGQAAAAAAPSAHPAVRPQSTIVSEPGRSLLAASVGPWDTRPRDVVPRLPPPAAQLTPRRTRTRPLSPGECALPGCRGPGGSVPLVTAAPSPQATAGHVPPPSGCSVASCFALGSEAGAPRGRSHGKEFGSHRGVRGGDGAPRGRVRLPLTPAPHAEPA